MSRDKLASYFVSEVFEFDLADLPKPSDKFGHWSFALERAMSAVVTLVTRESAGSLHDWRYDPHMRRFEFQFQRVVMVGEGEDRQPVTISSRFFVNPSNQKPGQKEGAMWDECWVVGEEVRKFDEGVSKKFPTEAPTSSAPATSAKTARRRTRT